MSDESSVPLVPCPSAAAAVLGVLGQDSVLLQCGLLAGHEGRHVHHMEWSNAVNQDSNG